MGELIDQFYTMVKREGGHEIYAAKLIIENYPDIYSEIEYNDAIEVLKKANVAYQDKPGSMQNLSEYASNRKKLASCMGQKNKPVTQNFKPKEVLYIANNIGTMNKRDIAKHLNRSYHSLRYFIKVYSNSLNIKQHGTSVKS